MGRALQSRWAPRKVPWVRILTPADRTPPTTVQAIPVLGARPLRLHKLRVPLLLRSLGDIRHQRKYLIEDASRIDWVSGRGDAQIVEMPFQRWACCYQTFDHQLARVWCGFGHGGFFLVIDRRVASCKLDGFTYCVQRAPLATVKARSTLGDCRSRAAGNSS